MPLAEKSEVVIHIDNQQHKISVEPELETIMQAALDFDINLPYSCMGGACSSCRAKLIEGQVEMDANLILSDAEVEDGYILTCQARPSTDKVILSFDD